MFLGWDCHKTLPYLEKSRLRSKQTIPNDSFKTSKPTYTLIPMRKPLLLTLSVAAVAALTTLQSNQNGPASNGNQATGAPGSGTACTSCHAGGSYGTMTIDIEMRTDSGTTVSEYVPGYDYEVAISVNHSSGTPSGFGAQIVPLADADNSLAGSWSNQSDNAKLTTTGNGRVYLEHKAKSATNEFTATWTAPTTGTGDVTFYMAGNAVNGNNATNGDNAVLDNVTFSEVIPDTANGISQLDEDKIKLFPNPAVNTITIQSSSDYVEIYNLKGELVIAQNLKNKMIDLSSLNAGLYFVKVDDSIKKIMKL